MNNMKINLGLLGIAPAADRNGRIGLANEAAFADSFLSQPLTEYIVGWLPSQQELLDTLEFVAPEVRAARRFEFRVRNKKGDFLAAENDEDVRALYSEFKRISQTGEIVNSKTLHKGLSRLIDGDEVRDDPMIEESAVAQLTCALLRAEILRGIIVLDGAATSEGKTWSTGADADLDLLEMLTAGGDAAGIDPNRLLFGRSAWQNRVKGLRALETAGGFASAGLSPADLAAWLGIDGAKISKERYQAGSGKAALVTNNIILGYNAHSGAGRDDPSNIKRFVTLSEGGQFRVHRRELGSGLIEITVSHYSNIVLTSSQGIRKLVIA